MNQTKPIRIAFPVLGDSMGGAHFAMLELTENLPDGYERVIILHERGVFADYLDEQCIPYEVLDHIKNLRKDGRRRWGLKARTFFPLILPLARYLKDGGFDLVHTQTQAMHKTWAAAGKLAGVPHIWHQHSDGRPRGLERRLTSAVICVSDYVRRDMGCSFPNVTLIVNANPFDIARFENIDRSRERSKIISELNLSTDSCIVGFIGNFQPRKRPKLFIKAAAIVLQRCTRPVEFVLFGADRSDYLDDVQACAAELNVPAHFMGFRTPPEINVAALDIFVGCSIGEGYGRAPVEAGLVGTPIVLSNSGNHPELIENGSNGFLVDPDNADSLSEILLYVIENYNIAKEKSIKCKPLFRKWHDKDNYIKSICNLYKNTI